MDKLALATPTEEASEALHQLARRDVNQMPVLDNGQLVGMLRRRDLMRWLQLHSELAGRRSPQFPG